MSERNEELFKQRVEKLERLRAMGVDPYPARAQCSHNSVEARALFASIEENPPADDVEVTICGRITTKRQMGKNSIFFDLQDLEGKLQVYARPDNLGAHEYAVLGELELGDFVQARGPLFRTRSGEVTISARGLSVLCKALQPPPEKWHGLRDPEQRHRQRYLDLMSNEESRLRFRRRSQIVAAIRRFMESRSFMEVETSVLQTEAGGAAARPFTTFFNALDEERVLRISLELHLKRLLVGGFDKVYEIGRIFRNEGLSPRHNPEFTMMESYEAYADYLQVAELVEELVSYVAQAVLGTMHIPRGPIVLDLTPPWERMTMREALIRHAGLDFEEFRDEQRLRGWMAEQQIHAAPLLGWGKLVDEVFSERVQPQLQQPIFIMDYPIELSPLAKSKPDSPGLVERFEAFVGGFELANAYSELNDPLEQRDRLAAQLAQRQRGDDEAELMDENFLDALEHGMPPAGGLGMGIDRLAMILLDVASIREVILFPQLRSAGRRRPVE